MSLAGRPSIRAILFDFDGVLADTEPLHFECWAGVLRSHGIDLPWADYASQIIGLSNRETVELLCRKAGKSYSLEFFTDCYNDKKLLFQDRAPRLCRIPDELANYIPNLCQYKKLGIVSSSSRCEVEPFLVKQGIQDCFQALVCEEDVENLKPAPDPYLRALEIINTAAEPPIEAPECLVVEDSGPGADAGHKAGMRVVLARGPGEVLKLVKAELGEL